MDTPLHDQLSMSMASTTDEDECKCAANIFYKTYQDQIHSELAHFMNQKFQEQRKIVETPSQSQIQKKSDMKISRIVSTQKIKKKVKPKFSKHELQLLDEDKEIKPIHESLKKVEKNELFAEKFTAVKSDSEKYIVLEDIADHVSTKSDIEDEKIKSFASLKGEEDTEANYLKEAKPEHVDFFAAALDAKMHEVFGESAGEEVTERGYFQLDYLREPSDHTASTYKMLSYSASAEEDNFQYMLPKSKGEWVSESTKKALDYLKNHKIADLFKFLGAHLVAANSCDPIDFLINLLDSCLNYRMGYREPPLLYTPKHIESLYYSMDPMKIGIIEMHQYHTGMFTLGVKEYNLFPATVMNNKVSKQVFMQEAFEQLRRQLNEMIKSFEIPRSVTSSGGVYNISVTGE